MTETYFLLRIEPCEMTQLDGVIDLYRTEAAARAALANYCRENWDEDWGTIPTTDTEIITKPANSTSGKLVCARNSRVRYPLNRLSHHRDRIFAIIGTGRTIRMSGDGIVNLAFDPRFPA
jgi:hypothetical protein